MRQIPLIVCGALGRMGQEIIALALANDIFIIKEGLVSPGSLVKKPEAWSFPLSSKLSYQGPGLILDFSHHSALSEHLAFAMQHDLGILIGSTGHSSANKELMKKASLKIPVLFAPNTSLMIELMRQFCRLSSGLPDTEVAIIDIHHRHKKDAPSGTALSLKEALSPLKTTVTSLRIGEVPGEHRLTFFGKNEELELSHRVFHRRVFAEGALFAAQFLFGRAPGLYSMKDVLSYKLSIENT
jgi:4-hydroxy-tetrahydrodipicolinate reductase